MSEKGTDMQNKRQSGSKKAYRDLMGNNHTYGRMIVHALLNVIDPGVSMTIQSYLSNGWFGASKCEKKELIGKIRGNLDQRRHTEPSWVTNRNLQE